MQIIKIQKVVSLFFSLIDENDLNKILLQIEIGASALRLICENKHLSAEMLKLMLDFGANPNDEQKTGDSILHLVSRNKHVDSKMLSLLLEKGANPNEKDSTQKTPFHHISCNEYVNHQMVSFFLDHGALNLPDSSLNTPFHLFLDNKYVYGQNCKEISILFLQNGFDLSLQNSSKKSVIQIAKDRSLESTSKLFEKYLSNHTIWTEKRNFLFSPLYRKKIFYFYLSQKIYFKKQKNAIRRIFPKHLLIKILHFYSIN